MIWPTLTTTQNKQHTILIRNFLEHPYTLKKGSDMAPFPILGPKQAKNNKPVNLAWRRHLQDKNDKNHDFSIQLVNKLQKMPKSEKSNDTYRFPTPQEPGNETQYTPIKKRILQEFIALQKKKQINPKHN